MSSPIHADRRFAYLLALNPDPTDNDAIARARREVAREAGLLRQMIALTVEKTSPANSGRWEALGNLERQVGHLKLLTARVDELGAMFSPCSTCGAQLGQGFDGAVHASGQDAERCRRLRQRAVEEAEEERKLQAGFILRDLEDGHLEKAMAHPLHTALAAEAAAVGYPPAAAHTYARDELTRLADA